MTRPPKRPAKNPSGDPAKSIGEALRLLQSGDLKAAEKSANAFLKAAPGHADGLHVAGLIAFQQGRTEKAVDLLADAVAAGPATPALHGNYGHALKVAGLLPEALAAYDKVLALDPANGAAMNDRGNVLAALGRSTEAEISFKDAIASQPRDPKAYVNLANLMLSQGRAEAALTPVRQALEIAPRLAPARNTLGNALKAGGDIAGAEAAYREALGIAPDSVDALGNLAALFEETNRLDEAREAAERMLTADASNPLANLILAKCERRGERLDDALRRLQAVDLTSAPVAVRRDAAFELSRLHDRLDDPAAAFAAMAEGNRLAMTAEGVDESLGDRFLDTVGRLTDWLTMETAIGLTAAAGPDDDGETDPVFIVGFPRSGTTLLGQVLDCHSGLQMIEERPMLNRLVNRVGKDFGGYPDGILALDGDAVADLRRDYFAAVGDAVERAPGTRIVDKFPLHLIHAGLIRAVFPEATFVFALRHPCDAVLSCFMQSFSANPAMANFLSVERAARTYDLVMNLWRQYASRLDLHVHRIRYEDVVTDFDGQVEALLDALGLAWEDGVRDFAARARARGKIDTPSYAQVTERIYTRARLRWRRYEREMAPAMPALTPWIESFGYAADDD